MNTDNFITNSLLVFDNQQHTLTWGIKESIKAVLNELPDKKLFLTNDIGYCLDDIDYLFSIPIVAPVHIVRLNEEDELEVCLDSDGENYIEDYIRSDKSMHCSIDWLSVLRAINMTYANRNEQTYIKGKAIDNIEGLS